MEGGTLLDVLHTQSRARVEQQNEALQVAGEGRQMQGREPVLEAYIERTVLNLLRLCS